MSDLKPGYYTIAHSLKPEDTVEIVVTASVDVKALSEDTMFKLDHYPFTVWKAEAQPNNIGFYSLFCVKREQYLNHDGKKFVMLDKIYYWQIDSDDEGKHYRIHKDEHSDILRPATEGDLVLTKVPSVSGTGQWTFKKADPNDDA